MLKKKPKSHTFVTLGRTFCARISENIPLKYYDELAQEDLFGLWKTVEFEVLFGI